MLRERISKTCNKCKSRKVRCIPSRERNAKCINCQKRGEECDFTLSKRKFLSPEHAPRLPSPNRTNGVGSSRHSRSTISPDNTTILSDIDSEEHKQFPLYVDQLIEDHGDPGRTHYLQPHQPFKANDSYIGSASIGYFSESRIRALNKRLGHDGVERLLERISASVCNRYDRHQQNNPGSSTDQLWAKPENLPAISKNTMRLYVNSYFTHIHPTYPFLDRQAFEERISNPNLAADLAADIPWSALYHSVLALGSQHQDGGAFEPGKGESSKFFQVALGFYTSIVLGKKSLISIQAITAMAIFSNNFAYMHIDGQLITEAARIAQRMSLNGASNFPDADLRYRTFWVIYALEKTFCFNRAQSSVIMDSDIGCPIPTVPEAIFGEYNWLLASAAIARILSRSYETLFSITATWNTEDSYYRKIDTMGGLLERWRQSIPLAFRPGEPFRAQSFNSSCETFVALRTHFYYHDVRIALCRLTLHLGKSRDGPRQVECKKGIMHAARSIIELLRHIDMEAYTPVYILALLPLTALFILFDLVIHNPTHPETSSNLALLEVVGGHFSRLEYATGGSMPSSSLSEFAYIARNFVRNYRPAQQTQTFDPNPTIPTITNPPLQSQEALIQSNMMIQNQVSGLQPPMMEPEDLFLPTFDMMPTNDGSLSGFNVTDLFGGVMSPNQGFFFGPV